MTTGLKVYTDKRISGITNDLEKFHVFRIISKKGDRYKVLYNGAKVFIPESIIENDCVKLNPDAVMAIAVVETDGLKDVMVNVHLRNKTAFNEKPCIVCRQNVIDIFAVMAKSTDSIGICISENTIPAGMEIENFVEHEKLIGIREICLYMDDSLDNMLELINTRMYDTLLSNNAAILKRVNGNDASKVNGACMTLRELLKTNDFMHDYHEAFNIVEVPFSLGWEQIIPKKALSDIIVEISHAVPDTVYVVPYDKSRDLRDIKKPYILATADPVKANSSDTGIYIVSYDIHPSISYEQYKYGGKDEMKKKFSDMGFS